MCCQHGWVSGELLVVTGPPGAGKSTVAAGLSALRCPSSLVEGDEFFRFLRTGRIDPWLVESHQQNEIVTDAAAAVAGRFATGGYWTIFDGVIGPWFLPRFTTASGLERLHYVILLPSVETCVDRVAGRVGHGFTEEAATRHMHAQFEQADLGGLGVIRDDAATPQELVRSIAERASSGQLAYGR